MEARRLMTAVDMPSLETPVGVHRRETCRLCGSTHVTRVMELTPTPPANAFIGEDRRHLVQDRYPLDLYFCDDCHHVQLLDVVDPEILFRDYVYVSGTSPVFVKHFKDYAGTVCQAFEVGSGDLVLDIGSNDGTLLRQFKGLGANVLGVDPAREIAARATADGIETLAEFFTPEMAATIRGDRGPAKVVTANNVFAHADDLDGITRGIAELLSDDGVFVFEVSYLLDVVEDLLFDTIYHEHLAYHAVGPLVGFFERHGLRLFRADRVASHGGSLRGYVCRADGPWEDDGSVGALIEGEKAAGLDRLETFATFDERIRDRGRELNRLLTDFKQQGKTIAGFGAPAKATTLMYHFGIDGDLVDYIIDDSPLKQGLFTPGLHIPVVGSDTLYTNGRPDYVVVLAWNFAQPIMNNHTAFTDTGGHFIVPLPELEIH